MDIRLLSETFRRFAVTECRGSSQLYEYLSIEIAEDKEMLELAAYAKEGQPVPNLLLGVVHYLLLKGKNHNLKDFYPSIVTTPKSVDESYATFQDFCIKYMNEIIPLLKTRFVQTNEVRRCSYLFPTFSYIYEKVKKPLALIEIGTSAGFQLLWDTYSYSYGTNKRYGDQHAEVQIISEVREGILPSFLDSMPPVVSRIGIDLHPIDVTNDEDYLWLNALIWPEHHERRLLFEQATKCIKVNPLTLLEGDGVDLLPELVNDIPTDHCICVFHTHVANQMPLEVKMRLLEQVERIGAERDIFHMYNNIQDRDLHLDFYLEGHESSIKVGTTDGHGRWFTWEL